jgi:hypothetical protein
MMSEISNPDDESSKTETETDNEMIQIQAQAQLQVGEDVDSAYGCGKVVAYRGTDGMYVVKLKSNGDHVDGCDFATLYSKEIHVLSAAEKQEISKNTIMELNDAYQSMEKMRRLNLEMECFEVGIKEVDFEQCTTCLMTKTQEASRFPRLQKIADQAATSESTRFPRIRSLWGKSNTDQKTKEKTVVLPRIQHFMDERRKASSSPCLICAAPSCSAHSSANFRKEGITLCHSCERLFEIDFIIDCVSTADATDRAKHIDHMIDLYDRSLLLLKYSSQYIETIATSLEQKKEQQNRIGLGSSGVGMVSGVLGVAAAATILTPAGPPLLIASLLFGGSASAVQTGSDAMNYFSEPHKLADRIIALQGMLHSILRVTGTLRDAMLRDHIRTDAYLAENAPLTEQVQKTVQKNRAGILAGANMSRSITLGGAASVEAGAVAGAEVSVIGARAGTGLSRAGTAAVRTIRFARFAGGALSAAILVMEANAIQNTLKSIRAGNPCDKAATIRKILEELQELPSTTDLDAECQAYLKALVNRAVPPSEEVVAVAAPPEEVAGDLPVAECKMPADDATSDLCQQGITIVEGETTSLADEEIIVQPLSASQQPPIAQVASLAGSSLLERIQIHKQRQVEASRADDGIVPELRDGEPRGSELDLLA